MCDVERNLCKVFHLVGIQTKVTFCRLFWAVSLSNESQGVWSRNIRVGPQRIRKSKVKKNKNMQVTIEDGKKQKYPRKTGDFEKL